MDPYRHTQFGTLIVACMLVPVGILIVVGTQQGWTPLVPVLMTVFLAVTALFYSLTVEVDSEAVRCRFGVGLIGRTIPLAQITGAAPVRNRWYLGWGIRLIPGGWMFNVSGFDAVEVRLKSGRCFRMGTDEPEALAAAIRQRLPAGG